MKLYYARGTCSLAPHIVLHELGVPFDTEAVNHREKKTASGGDYRAINPKGYVPTLQLDDGEYLSEAAVVLQYLADRRPELGLIPPANSMQRYRVLEWLQFIATELHKSYSPLFNPTAPEEYKEIARQKIIERLQFIDPLLSRQDYLMGSHFTVADAYLFVVVRWSPTVGIDLAPVPHIAAFQLRVLERPAVQAALRAEGLLH